MTASFDPAILSPEDLETARKTLGWDYARGFRGKALEKPDLVIAPDGQPYLYRWFALPYGADRGQVYLHVQVASDPERPLHDHPWDNQSVILAGGYEEVIQQAPPFGYISHIIRRPGDVVQRKAKEAHRLILPDGIPYTMSLFTTGPEIKDWGFWLRSKKWVSHREVTALENGVSVWKDNR